VRNLLFPVSQANHAKKQAVAAKGWHRGGAATTRGHDSARDRHAIKDVVDEDIEWDAGKGAALAKTMVLRRHGSTRNL
jgi:hypothetical protein